MNAGEDERSRAAAEWLARLQSRAVSNAQLADFARWRRDPANEAAYRAVEAVWDASGALEGDPDVGRLLAEAGATREEGVVRRVYRSRTFLVVAASALAAAVVLCLRTPDEGVLDYRTAVGERSAAVLSDGSRISIDTDTVLTAKLTDEIRQVDLRRGQAFFDVRHDPTRPFVVAAGDGLTVTALGTRFDVRRLDAVMRVSLEQGAVRVGRAGRILAVLAPGQSIEVTAAGRVTRLDAPVAQFLSWRQARLSFRSTPLADAIGEMNRYTAGHIVIMDETKARAPVSGDFSVDDPEGFSRAVNAVFGAGTVRRSSTASDGG